MRPEAADCGGRRRRRPDAVGTLGLDSIPIFVGLLAWDREVRLG